jgi:excisionase family DNA binding protein
MQTVFSNGKEFYPAKVAAELMGITYEYLFELLRDKKITRYKQGKKLLIIKSEVDEYNSVKKID